ncbi:MAG: hypothetical protein QM537_00430 [Candidatus Symbiobacter sp.]|nr:hypothetical protein [Candidatus Symbiobacter sp.]
MTQADYEIIKLNALVKILCDFSSKERIEFISEGLQIIYKSAKSSYEVSQKIKENDRESNLLYNHALEESAKIFILLDVIRCPDSCFETIIKRQLGYFYNHLSRLIYIEAQGLSFADFPEIQRYAAENTPSHYAEGPYGELIFPNNKITRREHALYADIVSFQGNYKWHDPVLNSSPAATFFYFETIESLYKIGVFSLRGLEIMHEIYNETEFKGDIHSVVDDKLKKTFVNRCIKEELFTCAFINQEEFDDCLKNILLWNRWNMPMYNIDYCPKKLSENDLHKMRENAERNLIEDMS